MTLCTKPFVKDGLAHPCGGCQPCRIRRRRIWTHRIQLEATLHGDNAFLTLTYDDEHLPKPPSVDPRTLSLFFKRLRKQGFKFRYYAVGEYGDETLRPHYHVAAFGFPCCLRGQTELRKQYCCSVCEAVKRTWGLGAIQVGRLEPSACAYVAGYVTKKIEGKKLPPELAPEFQRMSLRPGLGADLMHDVASVLLEHADQCEDVPLSLQHGSTKLPLGRYLRNKLRTYIGREPKCPEHILENAKAELQSLRAAAFQASSSFAEAVVDSNHQKRLNMLAKAKIRKQRRTL